MKNGSSLNLLLAVGSACVTLFSGAATGFSQCTPPPQYGGSDGSIYDPAFSAKCNWGDPNRGPDQTIFTSWGNASATSSVALAGAIASFKLGAKEFISSGGHGSSLNWAMGPQSLDPAVPAINFRTECYNPTLSGTAGDDIQAGWNWLPYHGPSTSAILQPLSSSFGQLHSRTRMAFYAPAGASGFGNCLATYPNRSPYNVTYNGNLSPFVLEQTATFGCPSDGGFVNNVLNVQANITYEEMHGPGYGVGCIAYLQPDFEVYYKYDPATDTATHLPLSAYDPEDYPSGVGTSSTPIIVSTQGGSYAIGMIVDMSARERLGKEHHYYYLGYNDGSNQYFPLQTMEVAYRDTELPGAPNLNSGTVLRYTVHYVFGDLAWVKGGIRLIYQTNKRIDPSSLGY